VDTLLIARDMFPGQQINLDSLVKKLKIQTMVNRDHHGALKDAKILTDVYLELRGHTQMGLDLFNLESKEPVRQIDPYDATISLTKEETDNFKEFIRSIEMKGINKTI
jgi:DNA polymerase-3 subunit epsilon